MKELSRLILDKYQSRQTRKQKDCFIDLLMNELKDEKIVVDRCGLFKSRNIIVGDLNEAKYILTAHYDTAPVLPFPNICFPKNWIVYFGYTLLLCFIYFIILCVVDFILYLLNLSYLSGYLSLISIAFIYYWMYFGKANKHTANDNTSGVITLLEAMDNPIIKEKCCFVFFDHEEIGLIGSSEFNKKYKSLLKDKIVFNFDCVSDGDYIMLVVSKALKKNMNELKEVFIDSDGKSFIITKSSTTFYPSDQMNFKKSIGFAALNRNIFGYYLDKIHTSKDTVFDYKNIEIIIKSIANYIIKKDYME